MNRWGTGAALAALLGMGCDDGADSVSDAAVDLGADLDAAAPDADVTPIDGGPAADEGPPPALETVSGELTYVAFGDDGGHIYSVFADGSLRQRVTLVAAPWGQHAVGPDPRYIAALRHGSYDSEGRTDRETPAEVWMIDLSNRRTYPISPPGCDAAGGGIGWPNDSLVMFAASCDGGPAVAYVYPYDREDREPAYLLPVTAHAGRVGDVFPIVNTPLFAYTVDEEVCAGGACVDKPSVWVSDSEEMRPCRVTDGDAAMVDTGTIDGGERRLGDRWPAFSGDLDALTFARNVAGKPAGPGGHFDTYRVGFDQRLFFDRQRDAEQPCGTDGPVALTGDVVDDRLLGADGGEVVGHERFPQPAAGSRAPVDALLFTGQTYTASGATSAIWVVEPGGARRAVTSPTGWADFGRWIVDDYALTGER